MVEPLIFDLYSLAMSRLRIITAQREEILEAFIAKYGYEPDRIVQVIQDCKDGTVKFFVRLRTDEEMEMLSRMSSQL